MHAPFQIIYLSHAFATSLEQCCCSAFLIRDRSEFHLFSRHCLISWGILSRHGHETLEELPLQLANICDHTHERCLGRGVPRRCLRPDRHAGSGIYIFVYYMSDCSTVTIGTPDLKRLRIRHVKARKATTLFSR